MPHPRHPHQHLSRLFWVTACCWHIPCIRNSSHYFWHACSSATSWWGRDKSYSHNGKHSTYHSPTPSHIFSQNAQFIFNVQHDCQHAQCTAIGQCLQKQERQDSGIIESYIEHKPVDRFVINMHALHNAHLLQNALPRNLTQPLPLFQDRQAKHFKLAAELRVTKDAQWLAAKEKRNAKKAADELAGSGSKPKKMSEGRAAWGRYEVDSCIPILNLGMGHALILAADVWHKPVPLWQWLFQATRATEHSQDSTTMSTRAPRPSYEATNNRMWVFCFSKYAFYSYFISCELVGPGGFLDSQTTDTQFFGDSQSLQGCSSRSHIEFGICNNDSLEISDSESVVEIVPPSNKATADEGSFKLKGLAEEADAGSKKLVVPMAAIQYARCRDGTNLTWAKLDAFINGPDWNPEICVWMNLPIVRKHHPTILQVLQDSVWYHRCEEEEDLMFGLQKAVHRLCSITAPANVLQGEFVWLAEFLPQVYPGMVRAAHCSDMPRMQELIDVGRQFLDAFQILLDAEKSAHETVNREVVEL